MAFHNIIFEDKFGYNLPYLKQITYGHQLHVNSLEKGPLIWTWALSSVGQSRVLGTW